ncbi:LETM1-like protein-domain-containing protein [Syncephalastrum racemosum]|uniref:LETM1-like protein-domain-containing protein n=1 Tax=Syncephalastrum racemosum TaxID=13706 RepID=A0A1X2HPA0_SYNRA|nr:LETM1-like protein-domain-containing protein [Syncephalastrum racemosum]
MIKLIPFGIIFCILPESIPLWVIFVPGIIPSTCVTPAQIVCHPKQRKKLDAARQIRSASVIRQSKDIPGISAEDFLSRKSFIRIAKHYNEDFDLNRINRQNLLAMCRFMGLPGWGTRGMMQKRLDKHIEYLTEDDKVRIKSCGVNTLSLADLQQAAEERGMRSIDVSEDQLRKSLDYWISLQLSEQPISPGLLVFSRQFVLNSTYK